MLYHIMLLYLLDDLYYHYKARFFARFNGFLFSAYHENVVFLEMIFLF